MGYNTVAFFLNDMSHEIESRPEHVMLAIRRGLASGCGADMGQAVRVLPSGHSSDDQVIMAGGNRITPLTTLRGCDHTEEALMRALAKKLGFTVSPSPARNEEVI